MKSLLTITISIFALCLSVAGQQKLVEPMKGSSERTTLMNAIREYDSKLDAKLRDEAFVISAIRIQGSWAYANVEQQLSADIQSYGVAHVFLQKTGTRWKVVFSTYNDSGEVGVDGLTRLKKRNKTFPKQLADFAMNYLAG